MMALQSGAGRSRRPPCAGRPPASDAVLVTPALLQRSQVAATGRAAGRSRLCWCAAAASGLLLAWQSGARPAELLHRGDVPPAFVTVPLEARRGHGHEPVVAVAPTGSRSALGSAGTGAPRGVFVALVAALAAAAEVAGARRGRCDSRVTCFAKKKGRGGKQGGKKGGGGKRGRGGGGGDDNEGGGGGGKQEELPEIDEDEFKEEYEAKMAKSIEVMKGSLAQVRAGKATPQLLDNVKVEAYESTVKLQDVATVLAQDQKTLSVTTFDESLGDTVYKAIEKANLGFSLNQNGNNVLVILPELTTDKRAQFAKVAKEAAEQGRAAVRNIRQQAMKKVKQWEKNERISEEMSRNMQLDIEAEVKKKNGEIDTAFKKKENEILKG